jgi:hypothetical protein
METNRHVSVSSDQPINENELEILIAKYTLEYLYRWTNEFDAAGLAQFKRLFDSVGTPEALANLLRQTRGAWAN